MTVRETRIWSADRVCELCIRYRLYTCGTNEDYMAMQDYVRTHEPDADTIYKVAADIRINSDPNMDRPVENIMYLLANEACRTTFDLIYIV